MASDTELLQRYATAADRRALDTLLTRHYPAVYRVVHKLVGNESDASDLAQATFLRVLETDTSCQEQERFRSWVLAIAVNEVRQFWRNRQRQPRVDPLFETWKISTESSDPDDSDRVEFEQALERALATFPESLRIPIVLHYYERLSLAEISELLGVAKSTVQSRCNRALRKLRGYLRRHGHRALIPMIPRCFPKLARRTVVGLVQLLLAIGVAVGGAVWLWDSGEDTVDESPIATMPNRTSNAESVQDPDDASAERQPAAQETRRSPPTRAVHSKGSGRLVGRLLRAPRMTPVANAEVLVSLAYHYKNDWPGFDHPASFVNTYSTDAHGRFVCDSLPTGRVFDVHLRRSGVGYRLVSGVAFAEGADRVDIGTVVTTASRSLAGVVVDTTGRPVAGARVRIGGYRAAPSLVRSLFPPAPLRGVEVETAADGTFLCEGLSPGFHRMQVDKPGFAPHARAEVRVPDSNTARKLRIELQPPGRISGTVVDTSGRPLPDATVDVLLDESLRIGQQGLSIARYLRRTNVDDSGRFALSDLPHPSIARLMLNVRAPGFESRQLDSRAGKQLTVTLEPTHRTGTGRFMLRGRVVAANGIAIDGTARAWLKSSPDKPLSCDVDASGAFAIGGLDPSAVDISIDVRGHRPYRRTLEVAGDLDLGTIELDAGATLWGFVTDETTQRPIAGAFVRTSEGGTARTNAAGRYEISGFEANGSTRVGMFSVLATGYQKRTPAVTIPRGQDSVRQDFALLPYDAGKTVRGRVVTRARNGLRPVPGAVVRLGIVVDSVWTRLTVRSDARGRFHFAGLGEDRLLPTSRLELTHSDFAFRSVRATTAEEMEIELTPGRRLEGRVVDTFGNAVPHATVIARPYDASSASRVPAEDYESYIAIGRADEHGSFAIAHAPEQTVWLVPYAGSARIPASQPVEDYLVRTGRTRPIALVLERGHAVRGTVVDTEGNAIPDLLVFCDGVQGGQRVDGNGRFHFEGVFSRSAALRISERWYYGRTQLAAPASDARLVVERCGRLTGKLVTRTGEPIENAELTCHSARRRSVTRTAKDGRFELRHVPVGRVRLTLGEQALAETEVRFAETTRLDSIRNR